MANIKIAFPFKLRGRKNGWSCYIHQYEETTIGLNELLIMRTNLIRKLKIMEGSTTSKINLNHSITKFMINNISYSPKQQKTI